MKGISYVYVNKENGKTYVIREETSISIEGKWKDGVNYSSLTSNGDRILSMLKEDFKEQFMKTDLKSSMVISHYKPVARGITH